MIEEIFLQLFNRCISAGWLIMAVIVLRFFMRKAPRWICCVLWAIVALRLICPVSLESIFSLLPSAETVSLVEDSVSLKPVITSGVSIVDDTLNSMIQAKDPVPVIPSLGRDTITPPLNPLSHWIFVACHIWEAGLRVLLGVTALGCLRMKRMLREAVLWKDNIWLCDNVKSPFILGIFRPRIYLPPDMEQEQMDYVLAHERAHLKRKDHLGKVLGYLLLVVYWFHPLVWVAYILLCRDIEAACDEKVIRDLDMRGKKAYSNALLSCSLERRTLLVYPLAFGEVGVKERVRSVLCYKKPGFWAVTIAIVVCVVVAVCFLTNPNQPEEDISLPLADMDESGTEEAANADFSGVDTNDGFLIVDVDTQKTEIAEESEIPSPNNSESLPANGAEPSPQSTVSPEPSSKPATSVEPSPKPTANPGPSPEPQYTARQGINTGYPEYDALIAKVQEDLLNDDYDEESDRYCWSAEFVFKRMNPEPLGYLLRDVDGNGVEELIFGENGDGAWNGVVYSLYTLADGDLVHVFVGAARSLYQLCENGCIVNESTSGAAYTTYAYYTYKGTELILVEAVIYHESKLYYSTEVDYYDKDLAPEIYREITWEEAKEIEAKYVFEQPQFTRFVERVTEE